MVKLFQLHSERSFLSSRSPCITTTPRILQQYHYIALIVPRLSLACTLLSFIFLTPLLPLIRPLAITPGLLDMRLSFILPLRACCNEKPYHIARITGCFSTQEEKAPVCQGMCTGMNVSHPPPWIRR